MWRTWATLGWRDFRHQTRRTLLGPFWSVIGTGIMVGALGYVYGALLKTDPRYGYPFVAAGLIAWFFISGCMIGGFTVFLNAAGLLKERPLPISFSVFRYTYRLFVEFCFKFLVFAAVAVLVGIVPGPALLFLLPGLILYLLNGVWVVLLFGMIGTRYRDANELISPLMLIAFLATPILWPQAALQSNEFIATLNPLTHLIAIVREPLLGNAPSLLSVEVVLAITLLGWMLALLVFVFAKDRIVFWL